MAGAARKLRCDKILTTKRFEKVPDADIFPCLVLLACFSLGLLKYMGVFMLAGGRLQSSPRGTHSRSIAKGVGDAFDFELPMAAETAESAELAAGVVGAFAGTFFLPLVGGLVTGALLAGACYLLSKGEVTPILGKIDEAAELVPLAMTAEEGMKSVGEEAVQAYNWGVEKINAQRYR